MYCTITSPGNIWKGSVELPGSKSESNRVLIIQALCKGKFKIHNLSESEDTCILQELLKDTQIQVLNCGHAGTTFRFLTAYFACCEGKEILLTGSTRMKERPIAPLVDALISLGAVIEYAEKEGYPPLKIYGRKLKQAHPLHVRSDISSQFISALLLIAPILTDGLRLDIDTKIVSEPYIEMTLELMKHFGISYQRKEDQIFVLPGAYRAKDIHIESDWSAASYWYAFAALAENADILLKGLKGYSLQGDSRVSELMANFGISSEFLEEGVHIYKSPKVLQRKIFDMQDCPDLAQTLMVCCAALDHQASFTGLQTLRIKETDRIAAMQQELKKINTELIEKGAVFQLIPTSGISNDILFFNTYEDHRMAMSLAALALKYGTIQLENPDVVRKSYPKFWEELKKIGFDIVISDE